MRALDECASIAAVTGIPPQLRQLIEEALAEGAGVDDIEHELIDPVQLTPEDHDAVWLYALARSDYPHRREIPVISG